MNLLKLFFGKSQEEKENRCNDDFEVRNGETVVGEVPQDVLPLYFLFSNMSLERAPLVKEAEEHNQLHERGEIHSADECRRIRSKLETLMIRVETARVLFWNSLRLSDEKFLYADEMAIRLHKGKYVIVSCPREESPLDLAGLGLLSVLVPGLARR